MLKIKDSVELEDLEKFGFEFRDKTGKYKINVQYSDGKGAMEIIINSWNRKIYMWSNTNAIEDESILNVIYDLIKADMVEKVSD